MNELKIPRKGGVFTPQAITEEKTLENLAGSIAAIDAKLNRLEAQQEIEVRGVSSRPISTGRQSYDYHEKWWGMPEATQARVIPLKEGVSPDSWSKISMLPVGASTPSGHKPRAKELEVIRVDSLGHQSRVTIEVPVFESPPTQRASTVDLAALYEASTEREVAPPRESVETVPTKGGVRTLQDSIDGLKHTFDRLTGKR